MYSATHEEGMSNPGATIRDSRQQLKEPNAAVAELPELGCSRMGGSNMFESCSARLTSQWRDEEGEDFCMTRRAKQSLRGEKKSFLYKQRGKGSLNMKRYSKRAGQTTAGYA